MAQDRPDAGDLLATVAEFLQRIRPTLPEGAQFEARVAVHLLAIVERQLQLAPGCDAQEAGRLRALLDRDGELAELNAELCRRIRAGELDGDWEAVLAHVSRTVADKVRIVDPRHLGTDAP